jgi:site-specific recombinase XerD
MRYFRRYGMKKAKNEAVMLAGYIHSFLFEYAPMQKTHSSHTLKSYSSALTLYVGFLETEKGVTPERLCAGCFKRPMIEAWLSWLSDSRGCSPQTCNNRLASLRAFLKYLGESNIGYLSISHEASGIPRRKTVRNKVDGLSRNAVKALLSVPDPGSRTGLRDLAFMLLLYGTAARIDEILSLKNRDLYLCGERSHATIIGKGNKVRTLYILPKAAAYLEKYRETFHGESPEPDRYVFYSRNHGGTQKMTQPAIDKMLKKYALAAHDLCADVPVRLHAHQFRHARASHWLEDGMNIVQISFLLGHEQLQTTMVYLDITTEQERKALATLEDECDKEIKPKWKEKSSTLASFCGILPLKK